MDWSKNLHKLGKTSRILIFRKCIEELLPLFCRTLSLGPGFLLIGLDILELINNFLDDWPFERVVIHTLACHFKHLQHLFFISLPSQERIEDFFMFSFTLQLLHPYN
uniref:Uncharacterized protein n=1 Tax=Opuntia streptacantha TaxID=393608 RepID=A0A7C8ZRK8_OPUST